MDIEPDGSFTYTPDADVTGADSFTFRVTDGHGASDTATVAVDIAPGGIAAMPKTLFGTDGNDVLIGSSHSDLLFGGPGNDVIRGGGGSDFLLGGRGDDLIRGGDGDDFLHGGPGGDRLFGGPGDDYLVSGGATGAFDRVNNTFLFFETDYLDGGEGNDTLVATGGDVMMVGGPGNDLIMSTDDGSSWFNFTRVSYQTSPSGIAVGPNGEDGLTVEDGFGGTDTVLRVHVLYDSQHSDTIIIDSSYQTSFGNWIEVRLSGGNDTVEFIDVTHARIGYQGAAGGVYADLDLGEAWDLNAGPDFGNDTFLGKVHVLRGSHFDDELYGSDGDDRFRGEGGDDFIDGRGGTNTIEFASSNTGVHVDLAQNLVLSDGIWIDALGRHGIDEVYNIQNVNGSPFDDLIIGDSNDNRLIGGLGNDVIHGVGGNNHIDGGPGADRLYGGPGDDTLISGGATGAFDRINNTFLFFEQDYLDGGAGNDTLIATGGDVTMVGGPGNDLIMSTDDGSSFFDFTRVSYQTSPSGIAVGPNGRGRPHHRGRLRRHRHGAARPCADRQPP